ncbi:MAG: aspartate/tyrosine/aromatic aminotransferase [Chlamydiales bacterium]|nr:aspartate/tyrosine/aromatic aminotransferase [Chlamydiales bacterium]
MFKNVPVASPDPIFNLNTAFKKDFNPNKINLGVGAYKTDELLAWVLPSVKKAEETVVSAYLDKEYLPIDGDAEYNLASLKLVFGEDFVKKNTMRLFGAQTIGGTGALRIGAEFLFRYISKLIYIPEPSWPNHRQIFGIAGMHIETYPYYNEHQHSFDFNGMCKAINKMEKGSVILLQASCHNPTGVDPSRDEWMELAHLIKAQGVIPFFDSAYQGFAHGIEEDVFSIREFADHFDEMLVAHSYSKNFGLYGERVGGLFFLTQDESCVASIGSQVKVLIRANYSNPPSHGMRIVKSILRANGLRKEWEGDVAIMRNRLLEMRSLLAQKLKEKILFRDFSQLERQHGMFSFCGLSKEEVGVLIEKYGIYMTSNGRISIAGLNRSNVDYVVESIADVLQK